MSVKINIDGVNEQNITGITNPSISQGVVSFTIPLAYNLVVKTGTYTAVDGDLILADTSGGGFAITIPLASANNNGRIIIKKISNDLNPLTITRSGSDLIDGETSQIIIQQYVSMDMVGHAADNSWYIT